MAGQLSCFLLAVFLLYMNSIGPVNGNFLLHVRLINYTNPSGLCAECLTEIGNGAGQVANALNVTPVCCDDDSSANCTGTCQTRFRWNLRRFGRPLELRPGTTANNDFPSYFFTDCDGINGSLCPFSEVSRTFNDTNFLGVVDNPVVVDTSRTMQFTNWPGRVQFFIEAIHMRLPDIIDSILVDLDDLELGNPEFTNEETYVGFHNISYMRMSFRVECAPNYCGQHCNVTANSTRVESCNNGTLMCFNDRIDPNSDCNSCINGAFDIANDCNTCLQLNNNPDSNCTTCLPGYDLRSNCSFCSEPNYDPENNCTVCLDGFDLSSNCTLCSQIQLDPNNSCSTCIMEGYDPSTNCTQCLPYRTLDSNCTECFPNRELSYNCVICVTGFDIITNCTNCSSGYTPNNPHHPEMCSLIPTTGDPVTTDSSPSLELHVVAAIGGGVGGFLLLIIILLVLVVCVLVCQVRRRGSAKFNVSGNAVSANNAYSLETRESGTGSSAAEYKFHNPIYGPQETGLTSQQPSSPEHMFSNDMYETAKPKRSDNYSHLNRSSTSPPSHTVKTGTNDFSPAYRKEGTPIYDRTDSQNPGSSKENTPQQDEDYSRLHHSTESQKHGFSKENTPQQDEDYSRLRHPTETSITLQPVPAPPEMFNAPVFDDDRPVYDDDQPVYDEAYPSTTAAEGVTGQQRQRHPSKSRAAYEEIDDDMNKSDPKSSDYDKTYPNSNPNPQQQYDDVVIPKFEQAAYDTIADPKPVATDVYDTPDFSSVPNSDGTSGNNGHYDKANHHPGLHTAVPLTEAFYASANFNTKPAATLTYDYADTFPSKTPPPSLSTLKSHPYDEVANEEGASELSLGVRPAYSNTTPGVVTPLAEAHYDIGL